MIEAVQIQNIQGLQAININPWQTLTDSLKEFTADFMEARNEPSQQSRESFD